MTSYSDDSLRIEFPDSFHVAESREGSVTAQSDHTTVSVSILPVETFKMFRMQLDGNALVDESEFSDVTPCRFGKASGVFQTSYRKHSEGTASQVIILVEKDEIPIYILVANVKERLRVEDFSDMISTIDVDVERVRSLWD